MGRLDVVRAVVLTALLAVVTPARAVAHGSLKSSSPAAGARLSTAPQELRLNFTEAAELAFTSVALFGPDSAAVLLTSLRLASDSKRSVVATIRSALSAGTYLGVWQMGGADGHPVRGSFTFGIAPGASGLGSLPPPAPAARGEPTGGVTAPGQTSPPAEHHEAAQTTGVPGTSSFDAESLGYVAIRWLLFMALVTVVGALAFYFAVLGFLRRKEGAASPIVPASRDRAAAFALWASAGLAMTVVLRLYAQSYAMHGEARLWSVGLIVTMLGRTVWGWGWLLQAAAAVMSLWGFALARRQNQRGWLIAGVGVLALAFTPALSGHAASAPRLTALAILADGLHVISAGGWLGSLLMVVTIGIPVAMRLPEGQRGAAVAQLVNAFSPTALAFAGAAAVTGVFAAWLHLGSVPALWETPYGLTLLLKLGILSLVAGTGAYNWLRVKPTLGGPDGGARVRRSASVELAVGVFVLAATAVLVATPTPKHPDATPDRHSARAASTPATESRSPGTTPAMH